MGGYDSTTRAATNQVGDTDQDVQICNDNVKVKCWNPLGGKADWISLPPMSLARYRPGSVVMDGKLYVAGGYDPLAHQFLSSVEVFDDVTQAWYSLPGLGQARAGLGLAGVEGRLYAVGGWKDYKYSRAVEMYDPLDSGWVEVAPMQVHLKL